MNRALSSLQGGSLETMLRAQFFKIFYHWMGVGCGTAQDGKSPLTATTQIKY